MSVRERERGGEKLRSVAPMDGQVTQESEQSRASEIDRHLGKKGVAMHARIRGTRQRDMSPLSRTMEFP